MEKYSLPGVSIAKPVCSATDPNLVENLTSYFELDYPQVTIFTGSIVGVQYFIITRVPYVWYISFSFS